MSVVVGPGAIWPPVGQSLAHAYLEPPLAPRNNVDLSREMLFTVLEHLSTVIHSEFAGMPLRLVAHGGACMLLHNGLYELANRKAMYHSSRGENVPRRTTTRDVDYIHRSFVTECTSRGIMNPGERLKKCIQVTARQFRLGADWMNSDADVALPLSADPNTGGTFDPVYTESVKENNIQLYTVFTSSNKLLTVISVTPFWAVALKLVRYSKHDPGDIMMILLYGSVARRPGVHWTAENLEGWIRVNCSAMNYHNWDSTRVLDMKHKIMHAIALISSIGSSVMAQPGDPLLLPSFPYNASPSVVEPSFRSSGADRVLSPDSGPTASMSSTGTGAPWAGPASDAISAKTLGSTPPLVEADTDTISRSYPVFEEYGRHSFSEPKTKASISAPSRHTSRSAMAIDGKKDSRRREKRSRELDIIMQRRSKYMLRSDEPDDSDPESSTDTELDDLRGKASHTNLLIIKRAPVIPVTTSQRVLPPFDISSSKALRPWGSTPVLPDHHSWVQTHITQEPIAMDLSISGQSSSQQPLPATSQRTQSMPVTHESHEPPPRRWLTSPLLEPPTSQRIQIFRSMDS